MARTNNIIALAVFLIILLAVLAVCFLYESNVDIVKKSRKYPNKMLIYDDYSFKGDSFVYLVCDKDNFQKCKIVQEKYPFRTISKSCTVTLDIKEINGTRDNFIFVVAFGEDKAILLWDDDYSKHDNQHVNISVVYFNDCRQEGIKLRPLFAANQLNNTKKIVTYDNDNFVVFFKNARECTPPNGTEKECIFRFRMDGNYYNLDQFIDNHGYNISNVYPVNSTDKRYVYTKSRGGQTDLYLSHPNGTETMISSLSGDFKISVFNEKIGACSREGNKTTRCYQYNPKGYFTLNAILSDVHNNTELRNIFTLPDGGFLLSFAEFGRCEDDEECDEDSLTTYFIQKIDSSGKPLVKLRFQGLEKSYKAIKHSHIWKSQKEGIYCAFIEPFRQSDKLEFVVNCFPITNFDIINISI